MKQKKHKEITKVIRNSHKNATNMNRVDLNERVLHFCSVLFPFSTIFYSTQKNPIPTNGLGDRGPEANFMKLLRPYLRP